MAQKENFKTGSYFDRNNADNPKRLYEIHFPHNFVPYHPWGEAPKIDGHLPLKVLKVCHTTHRKQAGQIKQDDDSYYFIPKRKVGKAYIRDGRPLGESYRCTQNENPNSNTLYKHIPQTQTVFPGCYSWWSLAVDRNDPDFPADKLPKNDLWPDYLKDIPHSMYGTQAFVSTFPGLLRQYVTSRARGDETPDLYLKMGGTLRYKHMISYVVIICTSYDLQDLEEYLPISKAPLDVFHPRGLVDENGKIVDLEMTSIPTFTTKYYVYKGGVIPSYETLDFALYFEDNLVLAADTLEEVTIENFFHYCICKRPNTETGRWECPDSMQ